MKQLLVMKYKSDTPTQETQEEMTKQIEKIVKSATSKKIVLFLFISIKKDFYLNQNNSFIDFLRQKII